MASVGALGLSGCGKTSSAKREAEAARKAGPDTIEAAVAGDWRSPADRARDVYRHPVESLKFWGLRPGQTVVEFREHANGSESLNESYNRILHRDFKRNCDVVVDVDQPAFVRLLTEAIQKLN